MRGKRGFVSRGDPDLEEQRERVPVKEVESCEGIYNIIITYKELFSHIILSRD